MRALTCAGAGFLLAVLWFDLMFDVQVRSGRADAVESIATYYRRVTTDARPMNRLVALAMLLTAVGIIGEIVQNDGRAWVAWVSLVLALGPMAIAATRTVPSAVRLGARTDPPDVRLALARAILAQHLVCITGIATLLVLQVGLPG